MTVITNRFFEGMVQRERSIRYRIFHDTMAIIILLSVFAIILESVVSIEVKYSSVFFISEIIFSTLFFVDYIIRVLFSEKASKYITSTFGIIDLLSFLPSLLIFISPLFLPLLPLRVLRILRIIRLLRLFRILEIIKYTKGKKRVKQSKIIEGLASSEIQIYFFTLFAITTVTGTFMHFLEKDVVNSQFTNIPESMWWAIGTLTTVGYGDAVPFTVVGKLLATFTMVSGVVMLAILIMVIGNIAQVVLFGSTLKK